MNEAIGSRQAATKNDKKPHAKVDDAHVTKTEYFVKKPKNGGIPANDKITKITTQPKVESFVINVDRSDT